MQLIVSDLTQQLDTAPVIAAPSMWTRPQIKDFKEKIRQDADSVITVGRGEVVTVRVPTHEEGAYLFWEFATDNYDIGFGVCFEWTDSPNTTVSVHVSESSDDDDDDEDSPSEGEKIKKEANKVQVDEVVPVYRRDCHEEVYAGSHQYPGRGVYLLKFDNSYSLWSKYLNVVIPSISSSRFKSLACFAQLSGVQKSQLGMLRKMNFLLPELEVAFPRNV
eukprot:g44808.t1